MVIILIILFLSNFGSYPLTLVIRSSILFLIIVKQSFIALSDPPSKSSNDLDTSSVQTIYVVNSAI